MDKIRVFVSFDLEHDGDLCAQMLDDAAAPRSGFEISGHSEARSITDHTSEAARRGIGAADQVFFICGEHTADALPMGTEFSIAQEEEVPYLLVWGRREAMCTKPAGAKPAESMYSWTPEVLRIQMELMHRAAQRNPRPDAAPRKG